MYHQADLSAVAVATTLELTERLHCLSDPETDLLELADPGCDSRIVLVSPGALELACALLRRGHADVTIVRLGDCLRFGQADVAVIPHVGSADFLARAIPKARRMLAPLGTIAVRLATEVPGVVQQSRQLLLFNGFSSIRMRNAGGDVLLRAELPQYGRLACA